MTKSVCLFFFSGTGNSWWVANHLAPLLNELELETHIISLESPEGRDPKLWRPKLEEADILGVVFPVYASDYPRIFEPWFEALPEGKDKPAFIVAQMAMFSGDTALHFGRRLKKHGYKVKQAINLRMITNIDGHIMTKIPDPEGRDERLNAADEKLEKLADYIKRGKKWKQRRDPLSYLIAILQRVPMNWSFNWVQNLIRVTDRCTGCGKCVRDCPVGALEMVDGRPERNDACILCARCFNFCPEAAISIGKKPVDIEKQKLYHGPVPDFKVKYLKE